MINAVSNVPLLRNCSINYCISPTARAVGYDLPRSGATS